MWLIVKTCALLAAVLKAKTSLLELGPVTFGPKRDLHDRLFAEYTSPG